MYTTTTLWALRPSTSSLVIELSFLITQTNRSLGRSLRCNHLWSGILRWYLALLVLTRLIPIQFDLFWPERHESKSVMIAWKTGGVLSCIFYLANALWFTVIAARNCGYFRGASHQYGQSLLSQFTKDGGTPLCYRHNPRIVASAVFVWLGFISVVPRCVILPREIDKVLTK